MLATGAGLESSPRFAFTLRQPGIATLAAWLTTKNGLRCRLWSRSKRQTDGRWPVPYAIMLIAVISVALWSLILAVAGWVTG